MSEHMPATIRIGGPITEELRERLVQVARMEQMHVDLDAMMPASEVELEQAIDQAIRGKGPLELGSESAPDGEFRELEGFCQSNGLSYVRHRAGEWGYDSEFAWWTPGMPKPATGDATYGRDALVSAIAIKNIIGGPGGCIKRLDAIREYLEKNTTPDAPPLSMTGAAVPAAT